MKRQKYSSLLLSILLLLQLSACAPDIDTPPPDQSVQPKPTDQLQEIPPEPTPQAPTLSPLPSGSSNDWNDIPETWTGTGGPARTTWLDSRTYRSASALYYDSRPEETQDGIFSAYVTIPRYSGLKDPALLNTITQWSADAVHTLQASGNPLEKYLTEEVLSASLLDGYSSINPNHFLSGNLLSVSVERYDMLHAYDEGLQEMLEMRTASTTLCAVYDLQTGKKLTLSDLFVDGTDLHRVLDPLIAEKLAASEGETDWSTFQTYGGLIRPYRGLPRNYPYFMVSESHLLLFFPYGNPYLAENYTVYIPLEMLQAHLAQPVTDHIRYLTDEPEVYTGFRESPLLTNTADNYDLLYLFGDEQLGIRPYRLKDALHRPAVERVNARISDIYAALHDAPLPEWLEDARENPDCYTYASSALMGNRAFIHFQVSAYAGVSGSGESPTYGTLSRMFDSETGEAVPLAAVLRDTDTALAELAAQGLFLSDPESHYNWHCYGPDGEIYVSAENGLSATYTLPQGYFDTSILE